MLSEDTRYDIDVEGNLDKSFLTEQDNINIANIVTLQQRHLLKKGGHSGNLLTISFTNIFIYIYLCIRGHYDIRIGH